MNKLSKLSFAALGGVTVLMLAVPADAAVGRSKFHASVDEIRRYCKRIDETFWKVKLRYGCGDEVTCKGGNCRTYSPPPPPPPPTYPQFSLGGEGGNGDGGRKSGGNNDGGQGGSASASGPNN